MNSRCFVDTSFYVALLSPADENHIRARELAGELGRVVTSEFVLLETANFLVSRGQRRSFVDLHERIASDEQTQVVRASHTLLGNGLALLKRRTDKEWSLTDCTSFVIMDRLRLTRALTADRHFVQAGFAALLA